MIKTRSAAQLIVEIPIEQADMALKALGGVPQPGSEKPVAVARLDPEAKAKPKPEKERRKFEDMPRAQQSGMLCNEGRFRTFLIEEKASHIWAYEEMPVEEQAAAYVREICGVDSRSDMDTNEQAAARWDTLYSEYVDWCGR